MKLIDRPPSSPSRFDLKTRLFCSQSQYQIRSHAEPAPGPAESASNLFEIVHRPPSQNHVRFPRQTLDPTTKFKSASLQFEKKGQELQTQFNPPRPPRPQIGPPPTPTTYEVKRGSKIYKVIVGYVSPFTSPLQRKELHLKTDGEVDVVLKQIREQQEKQRASKPQVWLGLPPQSALK